MRIKNPEREDFSDAKLHSCFSIVLLKKLEDLDDRQINLYKTLNTILNSLEYNKFKPKELKQIGQNIIDKSGICENSVMNMDKKAEGKTSFFKTYKQKKKCLLCKEKRTQDCHILKRSFFRKYKRLSKHFRNFENHISNLVFLCPTHHDKMDRGLLQPSQINKIVLNRNALNKRFIRDIDRELDNINRVNSLLERFNDRVYLLIRKDIKSLINKV